MAIAVRGSAWDPFTAVIRQFDADFPAPVRRPAGFAPAADVARDGQDVVVTLELPGVDVDKDVEVEVADGRLAITGRRAERHEARATGVLVREIRSGAFRREFTLPKGVTADRVEADYDRGLLTVRVRDVVRPVAAPAKVAITVGGSAPEAEQPAE